MAELPRYIPGIVSFPARIQEVMKPMTSSALILSACLALPAAAQQHYAIQPGPGSRMELRVAKTGLYSGKVHIFHFPSFRGALTYDAAHPQTSQVRLTLAAGQIKLADQWLSEKDFKEVQRYALEEMLDAGKYPEITFVSNEIVAMDATRFKAGGMLTIRGLAKPAVVNVVLISAEQGVLRFEGSAVVRLTDYGLKPPKAALGLIGTRNEMDFSFSLAAVPQD
ncbi:MAG TPA: YceI family protein [Terriglobia bacterium]|nr:YceI family protein [Terriglobia bacterium]